MAKNNHTGLKVLGLAAAAAAAAGAYYFYGKDGAKNRNQLKAWAVKARGEVMERLENMSDITEGSFNKVVDEVVGKYKKIKSIPAKELALLKKELGGSWKAIKSEVQKHAKNLTK